MTRLPAGTVTFLFTDIEASTRHWEEHPEQMKQALAGHDRILRASIEDHGGYSTAGDSFGAAFQSAPAALAAALEAQRVLQQGGVGGSGLRVRMAIHAGDAEEREENYFGPTLNVAARPPVGRGPRRPDPGLRGLLQATVGRLFDSRLGPNEARVGLMSPPGTSSE